MSRKWNFLTAAVIGFAAIIASIGLIVTPHRDRLLLEAGATADDVWTYIHTNPVALVSQSGSSIGRRSYWRAYPLSIEEEARFFWRTNRLFATRKTIYTLNTNSVITGVCSQWKFVWPF
jgi:hypothetical protein